MRGTTPGLGAAWDEDYAWGSAWIKLIGAKKKEKKVSLKGAYRVVVDETKPQGLLPAAALLHAAAAVAGRVHCGEERGHVRVRVTRWDGCEKGGQGWTRVLAYWGHRP